MAELTIRRALIAVYDKTGIADFARALVSEFGVEIISTGGTARHLKEAGIPVTLVEEITGFPEMLDGRVKTLHPKIFAAILADRDNPEHMRQLREQGIEPIDMVVVNLYPFEKTVADPNCTFEQAIEMIDIGGPALLRAAAKNRKHVLAIASEAYEPEYHEILERFRNKTAGTQYYRTRCAAWSFEYVSLMYDKHVADYLYEQIPDDERRSKPRSTESSDEPPPVCDWDATRVATLRYGENPHQKGWLYEPISGEWEGGTGAPNLVLAKPIQGDMSFNNYVDADAALKLCAEIARLDRGYTVAVFVKHTNPCGVAVDQDPIEAYRKAYLGDPTSAFGGVAALSTPVNGEIAEAIMETLDRWGRDIGQSAFFLEVLLAPSFEREAVEIIRKRKQWGERVRLIPIADMMGVPLSTEYDFKKISGGMLVQTPDSLGANASDWRSTKSKFPGVPCSLDQEIAWLICKHTKSNAISIVRDGMLIGNGAGQMSRVMSCRIAVWLANENGHAEKLVGSVAASDAFFPFRDGPDTLMDAGVTAIIQPGGSKRDEEVIAACNERGVAMIFTGTRHFKH